MNISTPITIDSVDYSREHDDSATASQERTSAQTTSAHQQPRYGKKTPGQERNRRQEMQPHRLGGIAQIAGGSAIVLMGIPMLILPGPGLVAIGGGLALAAKGAKTLLSK